MCFGVKSPQFLEGFNIRVSEFFWINNAGVANLIRYSLVYSASITSSSEPEFDESFVSFEALPSAPAA